MSVQTVEYVALKLKPGLNASTGEGKAVLEEGAPVVASQKGCNAVYYGTRIENPDIVHMIVDWENIEAHNAFIESSIYKPFLAKMAGILASEPKPFHVTIPSTHPISRPLSAPVTEVLETYFEPTYDRSVFDSKFAQMIAVFGEVGGDTSLYAAGWGVEEHRHEALAAEGEKDGPAAYFSALVGWDSVEHHVNFMQKDELAKVMPILAGEFKTAAAYHVSFKKYEP
ncbi:hypothetical protein DM02DRAFT_569204 [Periconia macrospinosa]|uniref:ABM domain-containing protein n=1 Tax=Periconia macrospinosa TaxID=97972 RepID=A0A2V1DHI3_9PLEO|nr:hypothetical protein DM02DRAFT_569204 [Periconia macrospinosa]